MKLRVEKKVESVAPVIESPPAPGKSPGSSYFSCRREQRDGVHRLPTSALLCATMSTSA